MPVFWPKKLQDLLPCAAKESLEKQKKKMERDWNDVKRVIDHQGWAWEWEDWKYWWVVVNTRTFYWDPTAGSGLAKEGKRRDWKRENCMALCPWADYFNHGDKGVCTTNPPPFVFIPGALMGFMNAD
jgi:hypothetical protein